MFVSLPKNQEMFLKIGCFFKFFISFLANCCLVMASLTFSAILGITLLFLLVLGMILIPSEWVSMEIMMMILHELVRILCLWDNSKGAKIRLITALHTVIPIKKERNVIKRLKFSSDLVQVICIDSLIVWLFLISW